MTETIMRLAEEGDAEQIAAIYAPIVAGTATSFEVMPPDAAEMRRRIAATLEQYPWLVCERGGEIVGYAYATQHRTRAAYQWSVDTSVYITADCRRRGVGRSLYAALLAALPLQGFFNAYAGITLPNGGSVGLHEAMGFQPVGVYRQVGFKLGQWHDVGWWQRPLQPHAEPSGPPLSLAEIRDTLAFAACLAQR